MYQISCTCYEEGFSFVSSYPPNCFSFLLHYNHLSKYKKRRKNECEQQCEVWTPAQEPQPSRIPHIPVRAGAGAGNRSEQACWAQRIVACTPFLSFLRWNKTAFFLVGHLPENSLRYRLSLPLSSKKHTWIYFFPSFLPSFQFSPHATVTKSLDHGRARGWVFLTVMQGTLVYLTLWVTVQFSREWMTSF